MNPPVRVPASWYHVGPVVALAEAPAADPDVETETEVDAEPASTADVYLFGNIGGWFGATAGDFVKDVAGLDVEQLVLHVNSPGGDAMEGVAIANVLRQHKARVVVRVDGMAASAASVIAMAGDEVVMGIGSQMMVHDPWGWVTGDPAEMSAYVRRLESTGDSLASTYAARAGGTAAEWREVMRAESWYTAAEAVEAGLADREAPADETGTAAGAQITPGSRASFWDLWDSLGQPEQHDLAALPHIRYAGRAAAPAPAMPARNRPPAPPAGETEHNQPEGSSDVPFSAEQLDTMRQRLGLAADADESAIVDAITTAPAATTPQPAGTTLIDTETLTALQAAAARGDQARAEQERQHREQLVDAAVNDGRIPPARREAWVAQLAADAGAAEVLAGLAPGLVPVGPAIGTAAGAADPEADALYASVFGAEQKG